jgi:hypothetical protein
MKTELNDIIEKTLGSLEDVKSAEPKPFFFTRLQGRLTTETKGIQSQNRFAWATLAIVLLANIFVYAFYQSNQTDQNDDPVELMSYEYSFYQQDILDNYSE